MPIVPSILPITHGTLPILAPILPIQHFHTKNCPLRQSTMWAVEIY
ncbi:hypothetical protein ACTHOZ_08965 [Sporosarcina sp. SAFN-010]